MRRLLPLPALALSLAAPARAAEPDPAALYYEAEASYAAGDVSGAFESMQRSYALSRRPELLFNLGELAHELGQCVAARRFYAGYLDQVPHGRLRARARARLAALSRECPDESRAPPLAPAAPRSYWNEARIAAFSMLGAGAVAGAAGGYFALRAQAAERDVEAAARKLQRTPPAERRPWDEIGNERIDAGEDAQTLAYACGAGALALATSGLVLLWLGANEAEPAKAGAESSAPPVVIAVSPTGLTSTWSVAF